MAKDKCNVDFSDVINCKPLDENKFKRFNIEVSKYLAEYKRIAEEREYLEWQLSLWESSKCIKRFRTAHNDKTDQWFKPDIDFIDFDKLKADTIANIKRRLTGLKTEYNNLKQIKHYDTRTI